VCVSATGQDLETLKRSFEKIDVSNSSGSSTSTSLSGLSESGFL
jgi:hypothetical protein